ETGVRRTVLVSEVDGGEDREDRPEHEAQPAARGVRAAVGPDRCTQRHGPSRVPGARPVQPQRGRTLVSGSAAGVDEPGEALGVPGGPTGRGCDRRPGTGEFAAVPVAVAESGLLGEYQVGGDLPERDEGVP